MPRKESYRPPHVNVPAYDADDWDIVSIHPDLRATAAALINERIALAMTTTGNYATAFNKCVRIIEKQNTRRDFTKYVRRLPGEGQASEHARATLHRFLKQVWSLYGLPIPNDPA